MSEGKTYTIHKSKKSQVDRILDARESLRKSLESTAHRLELLRELEGVEYYNDAKSVDLLSTRDSFKCIMKPIIWIAAATTHDRDYALIEKYVKYKIKHVMVYGIGGDDMRRRLQGMVEGFNTSADLKQAVDAASRAANEGDVVLFSPSCMPSDDYRNFADRGAAFSQYVNALI